MKDLAGRVAVITGGASGIGLATARRLAREGMKLVLADIEPGPLAAAERGIRELGAEALGVATDVGKLADVQALAERAFERFGGVHLLFNNAGVAIAGPIEQMKHADWEWLIRVNLWGVIHGIETFLPRMLAQGPPGHIVSTASFAGLVPNLGLGVYCATKYAVVAISEVLAREIGPRGFGVSVLCPMIVETHINSSDRNRPRELGGPREAPPPAPQDPAARGLAGGVLEADEVAEKVLKAVREERLYVLTHPESRPFIRRRFERIDKAFS